MSKRVRQVAVGLLLVVGVQLWLIVGRGQYGSSPRLIWYVPMVLAGAIPFVARQVDGLLERLRRPSDQTRARVTILIAALATGYLIFTGFHQGRDLVPKLHDENMYLVQAQLLARGMLWMRQHPVADSFETFHVFVKPVYAAIYFPGTALLLVPGVWLGLKFWVIPVIVCGCAVGLSYRVVTELLDGVAGILGALLLISLTEFRYLSMAVMSHGLMVFWGLMLVWAWLRWRREQSTRWSIVLGFIAGWAAITRPIDAACYAAPIGAMMLWEMRRRGWDSGARTVAAVVAAALPLLMLQGILNWGVTGNVLKTPDHLYNELYTPGVAFGFQKFDPTALPATDLPQRIQYYEGVVVPAAKEHQLDRVWSTWAGDRFRKVAKFSLPSVLLLILVPVGIAGLTRERAPLAATIPLFLLCYMAFAYFLMHYAVVIAPGVIVLALMGVEAMRNQWPKLRASVGTFTTLWIVALSVHALPEFDRFVVDDDYQMETMRFNATLESLIEGRALVLWHFSPRNDVHQEPVYNIKTAWPDAARVIRAQDRDPARNQKLFEYYAKLDPDRKVYWIDRLDGTGESYGRDSIKYLGTVNDLAGHAR